MDDVSRRGFLGMVPTVAVMPWSSSTATVHEGFPRQDAALAKEIVGVSHRDVIRVKELVAATPALARASWDWGFGDWETALGAPPDFAPAVGSEILN